MSSISVEVDNLFQYATKIMGLSLTRLFLAIFNKFFLNTKLPLTTQRDLHKSVTLTLVVFINIHLKTIS